MNQRKIMGRGSGNPKRLLESKKPKSMDIMSFTFFQLEKERYSRQPTEQMIFRHGDMGVKIYA